MKSTPSSARRITRSVQRRGADELADESARSVSTRCPFRSSPMARYISASRRATVVLPVPGLPRKTRCWPVATSGSPASLRRPEPAGTRPVRAPAPSRSRARPASPAPPGAPRAPHLLGAAQSLELVGHPVDGGLRGGFRRSWSPIVRRMSKGPVIDREVCPRAAPTQPLQSAHGRPMSRGDSSGASFPRRSSNVKTRLIVIGLVALLGATVVGAAAAHRLVTHKGTRVPTC